MLIRSCTSSGTPSITASSRLTCGGSVGKPEQGIVKLTAFPRGNHVVITRRGRRRRAWIRRRILAKAVEKGILEPDHGLDPESDRKEILDLIFLPGFTTRETVTEISGRGVGMDVVKKNVSKLSGMIDIETETGRGHACSP